MKIEPSKFWPYSAVLMKNQKDFFDVNVVNEARNETYKRLVKMGRLVGVHVSPTVIVDGVVDNTISSGWTKEQWIEYLEKKTS